MSENEQPYPRPMQPSAGHSRVDTFDRCNTILSALQMTRNAWNWSADALRHIDGAISAAREIKTKVARRVAPLKVETKAPINFYHGVPPEAINPELPPESYFEMPCPVCGTDDLPWKTYNLTNDDWQADVAECDVCKSVIHVQALNTWAELRQRQQTRLEKERDELRAQLNTPEVEDFIRGAVLEAQHQRAKWGKPHDRSKSAENWFWLVGYLSGKALRAAITGDREKSLHHCISSAAALANWHRAIQQDDSGVGLGTDEDLEKAR